MNKEEDNQMFLYTDFLLEKLMDKSLTNKEKEVTSEEIIRQQLKEEFLIKQKTQD